MSRTRVTLLTDFGTVDGYAAAMAGVIAAAAPEATTEHASHDIPQGDLLAAALTLSRYAFLYPEGTVHLVVVDPGVGTDRRALAARIDGRFFVAPDNGVLTRVLEHDADARVVALDDGQAAAAGAPVAAASATFHGRDLFAPAAARLARGERLEELGRPISDPVRLQLPQPERRGSVLLGEVIQVDRYGNLITNVPGEWLTQLERPRVRVGSRAIVSVRRTYGDVPTEALVALVGSLGLLEVSVRDGSAVQRLDASRGDAIRVS